MLDTTPDAFSLTDKTDIAFNTVVSSNSVTVSGIDAAAEMSIINGEYSIEGSDFTSEDGATQTVSVRHTSSNQSEAETSSTLTTGGISGIFSVTTLADNTAPTVMINFRSVYCGTHRHKCTAVNLVSGSRVFLSK